MKSNLPITCFKASGILVLAILLITVVYLIYFVSGYHRIPDHTTPDIHNQQISAILPDTDYKITTYNIGFGAYSNDYTFFMDGGKESVAFSRDAVTENIGGSLELILSQTPDFALFQEVDTDATRSYHINQYTMLCGALPDMSSTFAVNFDSPFIFYPLLKPHGKSLAGIATFSRFQLNSALRRSLPIDDNLNKYVDLDRCYSYTEYPVDNGKSLYVYNVHLSAYSLDPSTVQNQVKMLAGDMQEKYNSGNYVIAGGDFNQDILGNSKEIFQTVKDCTWSRPFDTSLLPESISFARSSQQPMIPTARLADSPYQEGTSFITVVDGFLVSDNVTPLEVTHINSDFRYSDHNPVSMSFRLEP